MDQHIAGYIELHIMSIQDMRHWHCWWQSVRTSCTIFKIQLSLICPCWFTRYSMVDCCLIVAAAGIHLLSYLWGCFCFFIQSFPASAARLDVVRLLLLLWLLFLNFLVFLAFFSWERYDREYFVIEQSWLSLLLLLLKKKIEQ